MPKIISITALKGGTGKTIVTFNIATMLAEIYNKKILIMDIDPQHNMTNLFTRTLERKGSNRVYVTEDVFENGLEAEQVIQRTKFKNIDLIPTTISLTATELQLTGIAGRESILRNWIFDNEERLSRYDYIFYDSNPTMSIININAFICSDSIVLVADIDADALEAINTFIRLYYPIQNRVDRRLEDNIKGLIINKVQDNHNISKDFLAYVQDKNFEYSDLLLNQILHNSVAVAESKIHRTFVDPKKNERSYNEFIGLIEELKTRGVL